MEYEQIVREKIGEAIQYAMTERKMNMSELERRSGVSRTIIYKIVKGGQYQIDGLIKVMRHLNIHLDLSLMDSDNNVFGKLPEN